MKNVLKLILPIIFIAIAAASYAETQPDTKQNPDVVKKSSTGICHAPNTSYYVQTKNFTPFKTLDECLKSGGRMPKR